MAQKQNTLSPRLQALMTTNLSPLIRLASVSVPRMLNGFLLTLDEKQRRVFDEVMPVGGQKKFYIHLVGTPTPPIMIQLAQPLGLKVVSEKEVKEQGIKGLRLTVEDLQVLSERRIGKILWRLKGQAGALLSLFGMFLPFAKLGPSGIKDLQKRAMIHFKPLFDLFPRY